MSERRAPTRRRTEVPPQPPYGSTRGRYHPNATRMSGRQEPRPERREVENPRSAELVSGPLQFVRATSNFVIFDLSETDLFILGRQGIYVPAAWQNSAEDDLVITVRRVKKPAARRSPAKPAAKKPVTKAAPKKVA